jgi:tetratricopeptide (TPR) repeat protein
MPRTLRRLTGVLTAAAATAAVAAPPAAAQQNKPAAAACDIDQNKPGSLGLAVLSITRVQASTDTAAKNKALREAVGRVAGDGNAAKQNAVGTAFTLAQAYALLAQDVRLANAATRAEIGLPGAGTERVDLLKLVDSTLTVVEQAKPGCAQQAEQLRQFAWLGNTNAALAALNAQQADSAAKLAERALVVYKKSPLPYYVLGTAAQTKGDNARAAQYWPRVIETTQGDTAQQARELRAAAMQNQAVIAANLAQAAPAAERPARTKEAADAIRAFLAAYPTNPDAPRMQAQLAQLLAQGGDAGALKTVYADQLASPDKYDDLALTNAGVIASQAKEYADAAKLFDAALAKNPFQRDALNNLTATYLQLKRWDEMIPVARRLVAVDPANPDNPLFIALAYQGLMNAAKAPAQKKAYADSLIKYNGQSTAMPVKVTFSEFTRGESRAVLGLSVEGIKPQTTTTTGGARRPAAAPAAGAPKTYNFTVEFLDKGGAVVDTQQVSVGPIAPGQSKTARVESAKGGVVAFRYRMA